MRVSYSLTKAVKPYPKKYPKTLYSNPNLTTLSQKTPRVSKLKEDAAGVFRQIFETIQVSSAAYIFLWKSLSS
jgi:hypothetical protein